MKKFLAGFLLACALLLLAYGVVLVVLGKGSGDLVVTLVSEGKLVQGMQVNVDTMPRLDAPRYQATTGDDGKAIFKNLPAGFYTIYFIENRFPSQLEYHSIPLYWVLVRDGRTATKTIPLKRK